MRQAVSLDAGSDAAARLIMGSVIAGLVSVPLFLLVPGLDTAASQMFYAADQGFVGKTAIVESLRNAFKSLYIFACIAAFAGCAYCIHMRERLFGLKAVQFLFMASCLAIGPGAVTNLAFKDHWGRARPREIVEFGGTKAFTAALVPSNQCRKNCSFVSGEASSIFMIFFAAGFLFRRRSALLLGAGVVAGCAAGLIRIAQGGHFLSDVVFAGIAMALTAVAVHQAFRFLLERPKAAADLL